MAQIICKHCGEKAEKRIGSLFCSQKCKNAYWNDPEKKLNGNDSPDTSTWPNKTFNLLTKPLIIPLDEPTTPPKEIATQIYSQNPDYKHLLDSKQVLQTVFNRLNAEKKELENQIFYLNSSSRNSLAIVGGISGLAIAKKSENKSVPLIAGAIGILTGYLAGELMDKSSKQFALTETPKIRDKIALLDAEIAENCRAEFLIDGKILGTPRSIVKTVMKPNPKYAEYVKEQQRAIEKEHELQKQKALELELIRQKEESMKPLGKIITSNQLANLSFNALNFAGAWKAFLGQPAIDFYMVIHGRPGSGKSTFSVKFAHYLAETFGEVLYISGEEGFCKTLRDKIITSNAISSNLSFADLHSLSEVLENVPQGQFNFILIDSLNNMRIDTAGLQQLRDHFKKAAIIAIAQSTKDGKMRGSNEIIHDCDIEVSVFKGIASTVKNRFYKTETEYCIFEEEEEETREPPVVKLPKNIID